MTCRWQWCLAVLAGASGILVVPANTNAYPIYGADDRGIGRLEATRLAHHGEIKGRKRVLGELLSIEQVDLRLVERADLTIPDPDPTFTRQVRRLLGDKANRYGISVLDLTDLDNPRYAEHGGTVRRNPGSVGKIIVAIAIFQALADAYPDDISARERILRDTIITADEFIIRDSHKVRMWNAKERVLTRRPIKIGDQATLWVFFDWMMSASSNAAAATMMKHAMLIRQFKTDYPVAEDVAKVFFAETPKKELAALLEQTIQAPLTRNGIDLENFRQGSFFTRTGKQKVPGTNSYGTSREMMKTLLRLEQGKIIDEFSSREIKRLLYMTERRIRYASSPALRESAVYFKSGSLYACQPEPDYVCKKYQGNKRNLMNSIAIVETPAGGNDLNYIVTLNSNVLKKNSAVDHQTLATRIHRLIEKHHENKSTPSKQSTQSSQSTQ